ncbi:nitroreductase family protein [candidate division KSB1 bacterium]|nr:nitroreductase family protein [candidate division KSB1 bacterium]
MDTIEAIYQRRSIRKFKNTAVADEIIEKVLLAATQAPSGKNSQPWHFIVVKADKRAEMIRLMQDGIDKRAAQGMETGSAKWSIRVMEQAPVTIFVFNTSETNIEKEKNFVQTLLNSVDVQTIGAAIQNLLLAAQHYGLGTLWICDVFFAYYELCAWFGENHQMIAAVSLGYPNEQPAARPRKTLSQVVRWL